MENQNKSTVISAPSIDSELGAAPSKKASDIVAEDAITISDEAYAELATATGREQATRLRCWDIQEAIDVQKQNLAQLQNAINEAEGILGQAKEELTSARQELKVVFDQIFEPLGLANKHVSVTQESPHVVTLVEQPQA
jgi:hypothetical protein